MSSPNQLFPTVPFITQTVRTSHTVTADEVTAGFAQIVVAFKRPFSSVNYTIAQAIENAGALDGANAYSTGDCHLKTVNGFTAEIYVNSAAAHADDVLNLDTIALLDE